mmetsp:Transcript_45464/g.126098  ORF Transcript_45464/g.126098 Transcript_45464/m.126098 type:complete len:278 (+) Transcript_45464:387-1220(+)
MMTSTVERMSSVRVMLMITFWKLPTSWVAPMSAAVFPKKVLIPVVATMPSTSPVTTVDPILTTSPSPIETGSDSPVIAAWSTWMIMPLPTAQSAGTLAPALSATRSPGTSSAASILRHAPSRFTCASGLRDALSAATASPARMSSQKPTKPLRKRSVSSVQKSGHSARIASISTASMIMPGMMPVKCERKIFHLGTRSSGSSLRPYSRSRAVASDSVRPSSLVDRLGWPSSGCGLVDVVLVARLAIGGDISVSGCWSARSDCFICWDEALCGGVLGV